MHGQQRLYLQHIDTPGQQIEVKPVAFGKIHDSNGVPPTLTSNPVYEPGCPMLRSGSQAHSCERCPKRPEHAATTSTSAGGTAVSTEKRLPEALSQWQVARSVLPQG